MGLLKILLFFQIAFVINLFFGAEIGAVIFGSFIFAGCFGMLALGLMGRLK